MSHKEFCRSARDIIAMLDEIEQLTETKIPVVIVQEKAKIMILLKIPLPKFDEQKLKCKQFENKFISAI